MDICDSINCTGCAACLNVCGHNAISMNVNHEGFLYPIVDKTKCVECGLCQKTCPQNKSIKLGDITSQLVYMCWDKNLQARLNSSSGGVFSVVAKEILSRGGVVCGAAFDENMLLKHVIIEKKDDIRCLQGSKYIQSDIQHCFNRIRHILENGVFVYFVGTPCQVAGLKSYLRIDYQNLITSDLICHGVPSAVLFLQQVEELEKKFKSKIVDFKFRSKKRFGQGCDCELLFSGGGSRFLCAELVPFFYGFWNNLILRESCYHCQYASTRRVGDITLGDFWLVKKSFPNIKTSNGISLVLINTDKGDVFFDSIKDRIFYREATLEQAIRGQGQLKNPVKRPVKRDKYIACDLNQLEKELLKIPLVDKIKMHTKNLLKIFLLYKYWK